MKNIYLTVRKEINTEEINITEKLFPQYPFPSLSLSQTRTHKTRQERSAPVAGVEAVTPLLVVAWPPPPAHDSRPPPPKLASQFTGKPLDVAPNTLSRSASAAYLSPPPSGATIAPGAACVVVDDEKALNPPSPGGAAMTDDATGARPAKMRQGFEHNAIDHRLELMKSVL